MDDSIHYSSFKNSVSLSLREGFKDWVKFGLAAFLEYDLRNYSTRDSEGAEWKNHRESAVTIGGVLNKQQGENLLFNIRADLGVLGGKIWENSERWLTWRPVSSSPTDVLHCMLKHTLKI